MTKYNISMIEDYLYKLNLNKFVIEDNSGELYNSLDIEDLAEIVMRRFFDNDYNLSTDDLDSIYNELINDTDLIAILENLKEELDFEIYETNEIQYNKVRGRM